MTRFADWALVKTPMGRVRRRTPRKARSRMFVVRIVVHRSRGKAK